METVLLNFLSSDWETKQFGWWIKENDVSLRRSIVCHRWAFNTTNAKKGKNHLSDCASRDAQIVVCTSLPFPIPSEDGTSQGKGGRGGDRLLYYLHSASHAYQTRHIDFMGQNWLIFEWSGHEKVHASLYTVSLHQQGENKCGHLDHYEDGGMEECLHLCSILWEENRERWVDCSRPPLSRWLWL